MILLDTHVVLWWQAGGERLSSRVALEIAKAATVLVSPITCWEIASLVAKGRVQLDRHIQEWIADLFGQEQIELAPLSQQAAVDAALLPRDRFKGDPPDQIIYATAKDLLVPLLTKDAAIRNYASSAKDVRVIW